MDDLICTLCGDYSERQVLVDGNRCCISCAIDQVFGKFQSDVRQAYNYLDRATTSFKTCVDQLDRELEGISIASCSDVKLKDLDSDSDSDSNSEILKELRDIKLLLNKIDVEKKSEPKPAPEVARPVVSERISEDEALRIKKIAVEKSAMGHRALILNKLNEYGAKTLAELDKAQAVEFEKWLITL